MKAPHAIEVRQQGGLVVISDPGSLCYGSGSTLRGAERAYRAALRELVEACDGEVLGMHLAGRVKAAKEQLAALDATPPPDGQRRQP